MSTRILFIGNFLSRTRGTTSPTERVVEKLAAEGLVCIGASQFENRLVRLLHIITFCLFAGYDKLHVDTFSNRSFWYANLATRIGRWRNKPVILNLHGGKLPEFYTKHPATVSATLHRASLLLSPSLFMADFFNTRGFQVNYLPNTLDIERFEFKKRDLINYSILWVRAFAEIYHPQTAISALAILKAKYPKATLTMVGPDAGLRAVCEKIATEYGLRSSISFSGPVPNEKLPQFYQTHTVFLNTTAYESFGMAILEAAASGLPIVSSSVGEIPLLWEHGKDILLVSDPSPARYAQEISDIFEGEQKTALLAAAARKKAETFDWAFVKPQWLKLLQ
jgi:glycosyltransferase involved in cell wall biosynthesis